MTQYRIGPFLKHGLKISHQHMQPGKPGHS